MTDWQVRLAHYGTPVAIRTNLPHHRMWWLTPLQHYILGHCVIYPKLGVRERARRLGVSAGTISKNIRQWCKVGIMYRSGHAIYLQVGVTVPTRKATRPFRRGVSTI